MRPLRITVLLSGGGRSLQNLIDRAAAGELPIEIVDVISSRRGAGGLERARAAGLPHAAIDPRDHPGPDDFARALHRRIEERAPDLVVLAGYTTLLPMADRLRGRVINIHPALLPKFGGKGYYGMRVHRAVIEAGEKRSGCTVHFVDESYDRGPIILRRRVPVAPDDTPESLAARVFEEEKEALPEAIRLFAEGRLSVAGGRVTIVPEESEAP